MEEIRTVHYPNYNPSALRTSANLKFKKCEENYTMKNFLKPMINRKPRSYIQKNICQKDDSRLFTTLKYWKEKDFDTTFFFNPVEISFKNECEIKSISDIKSLKELITRRPALQKKLKKLFQVKK